MSTLTWVLAGIVAYTLAVLLLDRRGALPDYVGVQGPIVTLHTQYGKVLLDRLARHKRFWRAWANFGVGTAVVVMVGSFLFLLLSAVAAVRNPPQATAVNRPRNVLVIPGVNDFLPLSVAPEIVAGLLVGLVVHEGGHGLLCRVEDIDIDSMGIALFAFVPVGAFVEPDQESQENASRGGKTRMFAAGVTNNFAITLVVFVLLFGPVAGSIAVAPGAAVGGVLPDSSADEADIEAGDRILSVGGHPVGNDNLSDVVDDLDDPTVDVEMAGGETTTVERDLQVTASVPDGPANVSRGVRIDRVNGVEVSTERQFLTLVEDNETVEVRTDDGHQTFPVGAYVQVNEGGPFNESGVPAREVVIVGVDGERTVSGEALTERLDGTAPDQEVTVRYYPVDGDDAVETAVRLDAHPRDDHGFLGIRLYPGVTGLELDDFGVRTYPAGAYLQALGGDPGEEERGGVFGQLSDSFLGKLVIALFLPIAGVLGSFPFNFAGFTGVNLAFYEPTGILGSVLGGWTFLAANLLFWIGWINVQLGFFNCIPAFPLDGGHILRTSSEAVVSRLPVDASRTMIRTITTTVGITMLVSFLLLVFGPELLS